MTLSDASSNAERGPFRHAATIYDSDDGFIATVVPFVREAVAAGEPTILALTASQRALLASAIGQPPEVSVLVPGDHYGHPLSALRANQAMFEGHLRDGATRVRLVGDLPHGDPSTWQGWARYEALCNHLFAGLAVSALCTYDTRDASEDILADVRRVHSLLADADGHHVANPEYLEPEAFLSGWAGTAADPLEAGEPQVTLFDATPSSGRRAIAGVAAAAGVAAEGLVTAVSEVLANAHVHGRPPVTFRVWSGPGRVVATVTDDGPGPSDPFAGLYPPSPDSLSGRGLWISNQLCYSFAISSGMNGCVVRMVGQSPSSTE